MKRTRLFRIENKSRYTFVVVYTDRRPPTDLLKTRGKRRENRVSGLTWKRDINGGLPGILGSTISQVKGLFPWRIPPERGNIQRREGDVSSKSKSKVCRPVLYPVLLKPFSK